MAGRKSKYHTHVEPKLILIEAWARDGLIEEQIAKNLGIALSTFSSYKNKYSELTDALKKGKEVVDREVENSLLKRALGYEYTEEIEESVPVKNLDGETTYEMRVTKRVTKEVVPDTTAQIFWLKNRKPNEWRDKKDIEHTGKVVMFEDVDLDE